MIGVDTIARFKPDPVPAIRPLPVYLATGQRAEWYEDTKQALQVPWIGAVTTAHGIETDNIVMMKAYGNRERMALIG